MTSKDLFYTAFPQVPTEEWREVIREELDPDRDLSSLTWEAEPGLKLDPFYREEDRRDGEGLLSGEHTGWSICDRIDQEQESDLAATLQRARIGGVDAAEVFVSDPDAIIECFREDAADGLKILLRGSFDALCLIGENVSERPGTASLALLLEPFEDECESGDSRRRLESAIELGVRLRSSGSALRSGHLGAGFRRDQRRHVTESVALMLAELSEWCLASAGMDMDLRESIGGLTATLPVGDRFLMATAGLRAFRLLAPQVVQAYAGREAPAVMPHLHAAVIAGQPGKSDIAECLIQATTQSISAVLGSADSVAVHTDPSADLSRETDRDDLRRLARNVQLVLKHEAMLDRVAGAVAGAYMVERLTDAVATKAWQHFLAIENDGGYLASLVAKIGTGAYDTDADSPGPEGGRSQ